MTAVDELAPATVLVNSAAPLILASGSKTRANMLRAAGLRFTVERPAAVSYTHLTLPTN